VSHDELLSAQVLLLRERLAKAVAAGRGLGLNRSELVLISALVALASYEFDPEEIRNQITEQENVKPES